MHVGEKNNKRSTTMTKSLTLLIALPLILSLQGCGKKKSQLEIRADGKPKVIGVSLLNLQHEFYQDLREGMLKGAKKYGYTLKILSADFDPAIQANHIRDFIVQKVDAMIICPCDSKTVGTSIEDANEAGIPVFTADIKNDSPQGHVIAHVASNNYQGGVLAAELMNEALNGKGNVALITHPGVESCTERIRGFKDKIKEFPDIRIIEELSAEGQRDKALDVARDILTKHSDLDGIFGINDDSALGALAAVEAAGKVGKVRIVGYDATQEARRRIREKKVFADVIQYPKVMGEKTLDIIREYFVFKSIPPERIRAFLEGEELNVPIEGGVWKGDSR
jgi:ribose transport system substrate-binding protein